MVFDLEIKALPATDVHVTGDWIVGVLAHAVTEDKLFDQFAEFSKGGSAFEDVDDQWQYAIRRGHTPAFVAWATTLERYGKLLQDVPEDALFDFLALRVGDSAAAVMFIDTYGVYSADALRKPATAAGKKYWAERAGYRPFALKLESFWGDHQKVKLLHELRLAYDAGDTTGTGQALAAIGPKLGDSFKSGHGDPFHIARQAIAMGTTALLKGVQPAVIARGRELVGGLISTFSRDAIYALFAAQISRQAPVAECPQCKRGFVRSRPAQEYCSEKCRTAFKQKRWREKAKNNAAGS